MRPSIPLALLLVALLPRPALGQSGLGLDLTDESKKDEAQEAPAPPPPAHEATSDAAAPKLLSEAEIASEDRVKSVQRKPFVKRGRFDLTPLAFVTLNDAFFPKFGPGARLTYHFADAFGIGVRVNQYNLIPSDNVRLAKRQLQSRLPSVLPKTSAALDLIWSPIYGKVSLFNSIQHFDLYVIGGAGAFWTQTSNEDGAHLGTHIGIGQSFSVADWAAVDLSLLENIYADRPGGGNRALLQHVLGLNIGASFYFPVGFDYREH